MQSDLAGVTPTKRCCTCKEVKEVSDFHKDKSIKDGLCARCKPCANASSARNRANKSPSTRYEYRRAEHLRNKYGITQEDYERMLDEQEGLCAICLEVPDRIVIDHCHTTGEVRGLLCNKCNTGIGLLQDSLNVLRNAVSYLDDFRDKLIKESN